MPKTALSLSLCEHTHTLSCSLSLPLKHTQCHAQIHSCILPFFPSHSVQETSYKLTLSFYLMHTHTLEHHMHALTHLNVTRTYALTHFLLPQSFSRTFCLRLSAWQFISVLSRTCSFSSSSSLSLSIKDTLTLFSTSQRSNFVKNYFKLLNIFLSWSA